MAVVLDRAHSALLAQADLLRGLDRVNLARLAGHAEVVAVDDATAVCRHGDPGDALYVVAHGRFAVGAACHVCRGRHSLPDIAACWA
jgi:CRP-like cAMP-binding protein